MGLLTVRPKALWLGSKKVPKNILFNPDPFSKEYRRQFADQEIKKLQRDHALFRDCCVLRFGSSDLGAHRRVIAASSQGCSHQTWHCSRKRQDGPIPNHGGLKVVHSLAVQKNGLDLIEVVLTQPELMRERSFHIHPHPDLEPKSTLQQVIEVGQAIAFQAQTGTWHLRLLHTTFLFLQDRLTGLRII